MLPTDGTVVKQGTFLYADEVVCDIRILETQVRYGTGDFEDLPEWRDDQQGTFYYIQYGSTTARGKYNAGSDAFATLEEAVRHAKEAVGAGGGLHWRD